MSSQAGSRASAHTSRPSTTQASRQPSRAMITEARSGKRIIPAEWAADSMPLTRPRMRTNQRETTTDAAIGTGLEKMTRPVPQAR